MQSKSAASIRACISPASFCMEAHAGELRQHGLENLRQSEPMRCRLFSFWTASRQYRDEDNANTDCEPEIDSNTFDTMWKMSEPGEDAEHCFLRIQETQFFYDGRNGHYEWYPEVSSMRVGIMMRSGSDELRGAHGFTATRRR